MLTALLHRELVTVFRQRRMFLLQVALVTAFGLLVVIRWPTEARMALSGTRSQEVFRLFGYGLLSALLLILPVFPATNIVRERNQGTLALLLNTPLGAIRIYLGKLLSTMGLAGMILSLSLPAATACFALGGISLTKDILAVFVVLIFMSLQYASLGLLISSYATTADAAVRWTYGWVLASSILCLGPHQFYQGTGTYLAIASDWLRCLSPFAAMLSLQGSGDLGSNGLMSVTPVTSRFLGLSLLLTIVYSAWTISRLNHKIFDQSRAAGEISDDQNLGVQIVRRIIFIVDPQRRSGAIGRFTNPVMVKEFRCRRFGRLHWLLRLIAGCAVLSLGLTIVTATETIDWGVDAIGALMVVLQVALLVLITPSLAAGLISTEIESGGWPLLQMTPLSAMRIVWGKLLSVLLPLLIVLCATLPGYIVMVYIEPGLRFQVQRVVICLLATAGFAMLLSAAIGSLFRRTATATAAAYAGLLFVCGAPLLIWLGRDAPFGRETVERALMINPVAAALSVIRVSGFREYELIPGNWWFLGISSGLSLLILIYRTISISRPR